MAGEAAQLIDPSTTPVRAFVDHEEFVRAVAVFPDRPRMVTGIRNGTLRLWDLQEGIVLKTMKGHRGLVQAVAVSRDGEWIASGDREGELIAWGGNTGESITKTIKTHSGRIRSLDFSPDGTVLATGSSDKTTKLWGTETWQPQGNPIECGSEVWCVRYSPSGENLAIATSQNIQVWNLGTRECIAKLGGHASHFSLAWTPNGTRLLSGGSIFDPTIREWDASTWKQIGDSWKGHTRDINAIAVNSAGTLIASASDDNQVRLWQLSHRQIIVIFNHSNPVYLVSFSTDGKHILSGGNDKKISEWAVPEEALSEDAPGEEQTSITTSAFNTMTVEIPGQDEDDSTQDTLPGFFGGSYDYPHSSMPRTQQSPGLLKRLFAIAKSPRSALPRPQPRTDQATELKQRPRSSIFPHRGPRVVEVAAVRDKQALFVARRPERDKAKQAQQPHHPAQSTSHTRPTAASISTTPTTPAATATGATGATSRPTVIIENPPWWIRFLVIVCCVSTQHTVNQS